MRTGRGGDGSRRGASAVARLGAARGLARERTESNPLVCGHPGEIARASPQLVVMLTISMTRRQSQLAQQCVSYPSTCHSSQESSAAAESMRQAPAHHGSPYRRWLPGNCIAWIARFALKALGAPAWSPTGQLEHAVLRLRRFPASTSGLVFDFFANNRPLSAPT